MLDRMGDTATTAAGGGGGGGAMTNLLIDKVRHHETGAWLRRQRHRVTGGAEGLPAGDIFKIFTDLIARARHPIVIAREGEFEHAEAVRHLIRRVPIALIQRLCRNLPARNPDFAKGIDLAALNTILGFGLLIVKNHLRTAALIWRQGDIIASHGSTFPTNPFLFDHGIGAIGQFLKGDCPQRIGGAAGCQCAIGTEQVDLPAL